MGASKVLAHFGLGRVLRVKDHDFHLKHITLHRDWGFQDSELWDFKG